MLAHAAPKMLLGRYDFRPSWLASIATLGLLGLLIGLGFWQLDRGAEKQRLLNDFASRSRDLPLQLDGEQRSADGLQFRSVTVEGAYDGNHQYLLDNRTYHGVAGYHVLTPLRIADKVGVLVNRGWVPVGERRERLPPVPVPKQIVKLRGRIALPTANALVIGPDGYEGDGWPRVIQRIELATMEQQLGYALLPYLVQLDPAAASGFVRDWHPNLGIGPDRHRGYAFQWFALAVALMVVYLVVNTRRQGLGNWREGREKEWH